ncbi:MAG: hypothetical protein EOP48_10540 [Sphingobacteriales bacterium]|nr:MAG: hypothetical protein EOP48_10540 [Sphingobacteriales bacterium]
MKEKYLVEVHDESGKLKQMQTYKTRKDIARAYNIPLYIVDKIIKISNDLSLKTKRNSHTIGEKSKYTFVFHSFLFQ